MNAWIGIGLDIVLIAVVGFGIAQVMRLVVQLRDLRASRTDMDRFVRDFNAAVLRAEAGIKALRAAARESGDDLEKLVDKAVMVRDELNFIVESADSVADRLSVAATGVLHADKNPGAAAAPEAKTSEPPAARAEAPIVSSRAEKDLMQALQKLK